jgi:hypothetical protein
VVTRVWNQHQSRITLKDGAKIFIFNTGAEKDTEADFMLHYFVTTWTPPFGVVLVPEVDPRVRAEKPEDGLDLVRAHLRAGLTLGCSNSNYP